MWRRGHSNDRSYKLAVVIDPYTAKLPSVLLRTPASGRQKVDVQHLLAVELLG